MFAVVGGILQVIAALVCSALVFKMFLFLVFCFTLAGTVPLVGVGLWLG